MNADANGPDLADIVVMYIKEVWPDVTAKKSERWDGIHAIEINGHIIGVVTQGVFATWNFDAKKGESCGPTDSQFFPFIKYWAFAKAGLSYPKDSSVS